MNSRRLAELMNEARFASDVWTLRFILATLIEHCYFREQEREAALDALRETETKVKA